MLSQPQHLVHEFRHLLLWPLQVEPGYSADEAAKIRATLAGSPERPSQWSLLVDEFAGSPEHFQERHYKEFVTFLPYVQRFLYGEGRSDSDAQRRQSATMMRLTVVTTFGLIGTVATGFLGMNLIAEADAPVAARIGYFALVIAVSAVFTFFAVARSQRLAELLEIVADEKVGRRGKLAAFGRVFQRNKRMP